MIEALRGSANLAVTGRHAKDRSHRYKIGDKPLQEIHGVAIENCKKAWRFSEPKTSHRTETRAKSNQSRRIEAEDRLIGFYDALAMIQTERFMRRLEHSKTIPISDNDMKTMEWLHERIRNEYEHFVPKLYAAPVQDLVAATELCLGLSTTLLFESGNVIFHNVCEDNFKQLFQQVLDELTARNPPER